MADTIVDSLVVRFGLDPKPYEQGRKRVTEDMRRVRDQAQTVASDVEASGKRAANFFGSLRNEVVGLFLAFAGARGITGFVGGMIESDAAVGRLAKNLGVATRELSAWQGVARRTGGNAGDADTAFRILAGENQQRLLTGQATHAADFQGLGIMPEDLANPTEALLKMAAAGERMTRPEFVARLQRIGIPEAVITSLTKGRRETEALLKEQYQLGTATDRSSEAAQRMEGRISDLQTAIKGKARPWIEALLETILKLANNTDAAAVALPALGIAAAALAAPFIAAYAPVMALGAALAFVLYKTDALKRAAPEMGASVNRAGSAMSRAAEEWKILTSRDKNGQMDTAKLGVLFWQDLEQTFGFKGPHHFDTMDPDVRSMLDKMYGKSTGGPLSGSGLDRVFNALVRQESGGNGMAISSAGALGSTQMLPATAMNMARKLGIPWRADLIRGNSPAAIAYQRRLGRAYFDEGMQKYGGNVEQALMYYHGGPDQRQWGRKTHAYARSIMSAVGAGGGGSSETTVHIGTINTRATDARGLAAELPGAIARRGLAVNANSGLSM